MFLSLLVIVYRGEGTTYLDIGFQPPDQSFVYGTMDVLFECKDDTDSQKVLGQSLKDHLVAQKKRS